LQHLHQVTVIEILTEYRGEKITVKEWFSTEAPVQQGCGLSILEDR